MTSGMQTVLYPVEDMESAQTTMKKVAYWVCTGLVAFFMSGGLAYALQVPDVVQGVVALGFPVHFIVLLGVWKVLGAIAILMPGFALIKEWAYAGIVFDLTGAASTSIATGGEWWHVAAPLSIAVLLAVSWALRPESRRLPGAAIAIGSAHWKAPRPRGTNVCVPPVRAMLVRRSVFVRGMKTRSVAFSRSRRPEDLSRN